MILTLLFNYKEDQLQLNSKQNKEKKPPEFDIFFFKKLSW
jgi:hypothetical protein